MGYLKTLEAKCGRRFGVRIEQDQDNENPLTAWDCASDVIFQPRGYQYQGRTPGFVQLYGVCRGYLVITDETPETVLYVGNNNTRTPASEYHKLAAFASFGDRSHTVYLGITKARALRETHHKRFNQHTKAWAEQIVKAECATMQQYLDGDVWGYIVDEINEDDEPICAHVDSLWGLFGQDYAKIEALATLDIMCQQADAEAIASAACYV